MIKNYLPHYSVGVIVKGFGRGSKDLGCPTGTSFFTVQSQKSILMKPETFIQPNKLIV